MKKNEKIKIVHIAQANGGVEVYLKMFFKYFDNNEYENYIILSEQYIDSKEYFEKLGIKVFLVDMCREISFRKDLKSIVNIFNIIRKIKPDIVYTHSSKAGGLGRIPAKLVGAKNIYNPHGWAFDMNLSSIKKCIFISIEKILSYITDQVVAISQYEMEVAINNKIIDASKIVLIENGIDLDNFNNQYNSIELLKELKWSKDDIIIGMIARIVEQKSPNTFINVAERILIKYPNCKFIMVGDGDQRGEIEKILKEKKLESKFYITGWVKDTFKYLQIFDIALLTSKWEGFGLVIPEYMAAKKPVVASKVGGINNIISHGIDGYLVSDLDIDSFEKYISILLEDNIIREKIVENAFKKVNERYDFKRVVNQHDLLFKRITMNCSFDNLK